MAATPDKIVQRLRDKIIRGRLRSGERVPDRKALARQYGTSLATMQRVVDELVSDGFLEVGARKKGTVVAQNLPHLSHYTLVFPEKPLSHNLFWSALLSQARALEAESEKKCRFSFFFGVRGHMDIGAYQSLVEDVRRHRVAGLIFALSGETFDGTPLMDAPNLPRAAIGHAYEFPGVPKVDVDYRDFFQKSVDQLVQRGRRKIALISPSGWRETHDCIRYFVDAARARGVEVKPIWMQFGDLRNESSVHNVIQLLFHPGFSEKPDGLVVADDHLVEHVSEGLLRAGVRVGESMEMVGLSNFPHPPKCAVPMIRVGFDVRRILRTLVGFIDQAIAGKKPPIMSYEPAVVDDAES